VINHVKITTAVWLAPPDSTARVDIGSYSADPTGTMVSYGEQSQTVPLKEKNVVVKFAVEANSQTSQGKIIVAATIHKTAEGINIKQPECHSSSAKLAFLAYAQWRHPAYHRAAREIQG
jgi:hypothetical protein